MELGSNEKLRRCMPTYVSTWFQTHNCCRSLLEAGWKLKAFERFPGCYIP